MNPLSKPFFLPIGGFIFVFELKIVLIKLMYDLNNLHATSDETSLPPLQYKDGFCLI